MIEDKQPLNTDSKAILDKDGKPVNIISLTPEPSVEIFTLGGFGARKAAEETDKNDHH